MAGAMMEHSPMTALARGPIQAAPSTALIVLPSWVGDAVMATPALRAVRAAWPQTRLVGFARPGLAELLAGTSLIDDFAEHAMRGLHGPFAAARLVRKTHH